MSAARRVVLVSALALALVAAGGAGQGAGAGYGTCKPKVVHAYRTWQNWAGLTFWRYTAQVRWCWKAGRITFYSFTRVGEVVTTTPLLRWGSWQFEGHTAGDVQGGPAIREAWTQGAFKVCLIEALSLCRHEEPSLGITVYGNGRYSAWTRP